jgi:putative FmdB family regulatory protein
MPTYEYTCPVCGEFEAWRPAAHAGEPVACPACGAGAPRHYGPPNLRRTPAPLAAAIERSQRSAHEPQVVSAPPTAGQPLKRHAPHRQRRPWQLT